MPQLIRLCYSGAGYLGDLRGQEVIIILSPITPQLHYHSIALFWALNVHKADTIPAPQKMHPGKTEQKTKTKVVEGSISMYSMICPFLM